MHLPCLAAYESWPVLAPSCKAVVEQEHVMKLKSRQSAVRVCESDGGEEERVARALK